jgi:hypothetical protein
LGLDNVKWYGATNIDRAAPFAFQTRSDPYLASIHFVWQVLRAVGGDERLRAALVDAETAVAASESAAAKYERALVNMQLKHWEDAFVYALMMISFTLYYLSWLELFGAATFPRLQATRMNRPIQTYYGKEQNVSNAW